MAECKGGVVEHMGFSAAERRHAFYTVCLPVRIGLIVLVGAMIARNQYAAAAVVFVCAMISTAFLLHQASNGCRVWWNRRVHAAFAALLAIAAVCSLYGVVSPWSMPLVLLLDWLYSLCSSLMFADFH